MTLKEIIIKDFQKARKAKKKEKALVLSTLIGELDRIGKNPIDAEVIKKIKGLVESNKTIGCESENVIISVYLPQMLDEVTLEFLIKSYIKNNNCSGMKDMGKVMGFLSSRHAGSYDGKVASQIVKKLL
jgi:uncharacterized protein YqeY